MLFGLGALTEEQVLFKYHPCLKPPKDGFDPLLHAKISTEETHQHEVDQEWKYEGAAEGLEMCAGATPIPCFPCVDHVHRLWTDSQRTRCAG